MNANAFYIQQMTSRTRWAAMCFVLTFVVKFAALVAGFAGMKTLALVLFGVAFVSIFSAVGLCTSQMLSDSNVDKPGKLSEWGPDIVGTTQVKPGLYVQDDDQ